MPDSINRREFINHSAMTGVAAAGLSLADVARANSANNKVVVGIMGLGRGRSLAAGFARQPNVEVKYVCDADTRRLSGGIKAVEGIAGNTPEGVQDFRRMLDDKSVDALVCAAPNHWHAPATILACSAGKHMYVEKPCSHNGEEGELMVQAARKNKRAVQMGTQRRSGPGTNQAIAKLREGVIGKVYHARCWYDNTRPSIGDGVVADVPKELNYELWQGPAPHRPYKSNVVHYNWHWRWHWGNGELGNNGVHTLDLCRWGMGVDYPDRVSSSGGRYHYDDDQETPDTHTVGFEFDGVGEITWQGKSCNRYSRGGFVTFYGTQGAMELDSNGKHRIYDQRGKLVNETSSAGLGDAEHILNFLTAIREDKPLELNAEILEGHKSTLLCHLGNIAYRVGRSLACDKKNGHIVNDPKAMALWGRDYQKGWEPKV